MANFLYGLILGRNAPRVPAVAGIAGERLRVVDCGALGALVATTVQAPARASLEDVRAYDGALRDVVAAGVTVAPTRFGQTFPGDDAVRAEVASGGGRVAEILERHDGCVEMRILLPMDAIPAEQREAAPLPDAPGHAYLERLRREHAERHPDVSLRAVFGPLVRGERVERLGDDAGIAVAHLILASDEDDWRAAVTAMPALAAARVVGPLPLYAFVAPTGGPDE